MTQLHKGYVTESLRTDGIGWWMQQGEPRTVDGTPMVHVGHAILPADGWHADRSAAVLEVASRIEQLGNRLLAQAERLRADAATEAARKAVVTT